MLALLALSGPAGAAGDPSKAGAYCPFPKPGEKPACFQEAEEEYADFFAAIDAGATEGESVAQLERTLQGEQTEAGADRTLALSSLAYGYYTLAQRAASSERPDPALVARLAHWNELLGSVYAEADEQPALRTAVREAALDLEARAPSVECADGESCPNPGLLLQTLRRIDDPAAASETGVRGALGKLLGRVLEDDTESTGDPVAE